MNPTISEVTLDDLLAMSRPDLVDFLARRDGVISGRELSSIIRNLVTGASYQAGIVEGLLARIGALEKEVRSEATAKAESPLLFGGVPAEAEAAAPSHNDQSIKTLADP